MEDEEIWLPVPSLPAYMASSHGRVMVIPYTGTMPNGGARQYGGLQWFGVWHKDVRRFMITYKGKNYKVARLICEAFHGAPPFKRAVCMHGDENSRNNRSVNLSWGTQKENLNAPGFLEYCRGRTGENSPIIKGRAKKQSNAEA